MSMDRANELMAFFGDYPPANVVLSLVHVKRDRGGKSKRQSHEPTEDEAMGGLTQLSGMMGTAPQKVPKSIRDLADWARETLKNPKKAKQKLDAK